MENSSSYVVTTYMRSGLTWRLEKEREKERRKK